MNMKGQGGPVPELYFPIGSDMMSDLRSDPDGGLRMEYELFTRLSGLQEASMPHVSPILTSLNCSDLCATQVLQILHGLLRWHPKPPVLTQHQHVLHGVIILEIRYNLGGGSCICFLL